MYPVNSIGAAVLHLLPIFFIVAHCTGHYGLGMAAVLSLSYIRRVAE